jgi:hypothetical protein
MFKNFRKIIILSCLLSGFSSCQFAQTKLDGMKILRAANLAHGGDKLDNLKTIRIKGSDNFGFENITLIDLINKKYRRESRKNNVLEVTQLEANDGWSWANNKKSQLSEVEKNQMKRVFYFRELGLRSSLLKSISVFDAKPFNEMGVKGIAVNIEIEGEKHSLIFDTNNHLIGDVWVKDENTYYSFFDDFRSVNEILFSFSQSAEATNPNQPIIGAKKAITKTSSIEVNPVFTENDWSVPN